MGIEYDLMNLPEPVQKIRDKWVSERKYEDGEPLSEQDKILLTVGFDVGFSIGFQHRAFVDGMNVPIPTPEKEGG